MARPPVRVHVLAGRRAFRALSIAVVAGLLALVTVCLLPSSQASAQSLLHFPPRPTPTPAPAQPPDAPMLVQADEIKYDYTNNTVAAVGNVQIYFNGSTVEADQIIYDQKTKRLQARGNARITEADGKITYGQFIDLTQDYRDGFVDSLRLETASDTRFAASRADRVGGNYTVMQNGVYTACEPCKDDPKKPPLWQVQAARIVHDNDDKMIYFENAKVEFFGVPLLYFPFMSAPDPSVTRKTGFLYPTFTYGTAYGVAAEVPYFWAVSPSSDLTVSTMLSSGEGPLLQGIWRQRLEDGSYSIKAAGVYQTNPGHFADEGDRIYKRLSRRGPERRPVCAERQVGMGLERSVDDRQILFGRLSARRIPRRLRSVSLGNCLGGRFSSVPHRFRRAQLLRYPLNLLLRFLRI